jgi:CheY-like chemotaxis protein
MSGKLKILLVDDNPMVLRMLEQAVAPLGSVLVAASGAEASHKAAESMPDLIVTDFQMPGLDGGQLVERLRAQPATSSIPVILMAGRNEIEKLMPLHSSIEDFLEKPFFARDAAARIRRVLDKIGLEKLAREAPDEAMVRGSLAQMNVIDLVQSLELGRKTCRLTLTREGEICQMFFTDGQINHAQFGENSGDQAVYKALTWTGPAGTFQIDFSASTRAHTTTHSTQGLLMEGLRLLDEANRDRHGNEEG